MAFEEQLYGARDVARIFGLPESRVLYWSRTGVVSPSVTRGARRLFRFQDLISVKAAKELLDRGVSLQAVRKNLAALRGALPSEELDRPLTRLRVVSDGDELVVIGDDVAYEPLSGQVVMDFVVGALSERVAEVMELPSAEATMERSAWGWFREGLALDERGHHERAEEALLRALEIDPCLAAAHTNLGDLAFGRGDVGGAQKRWERALALDPEQPEARYNLANLLDERGDTQRAISEWTRVVALAPDFADAHFNLGAALLGSGRASTGRAHLERYLELDSDGPWAETARGLLTPAITPPAVAPKSERKARRRSALVPQQGPAKG